MIENCPYCDAENPGIAHDGDEDVNVNLKHECMDCGKTFMYMHEVSVDTWTYKADCLNGDSPHKWRMDWYHKGKKRWSCRVCDEYKILQDGEEP